MPESVLQPAPVSTNSLGWRSMNSCSDIHRTYYAEAQLLQLADQLRPLHRLVGGQGVIDDPMHPMKEVDGREPRVFHRPGTVSRSLPEQGGQVFHHDIGMAAVGFKLVKHQIV